MFIQTEQTPNPQTLKFLPGRVVMEEGTAFFQNITDSSNSPFAKRLFGVEGVEGVFFGSDFITITKSDELDWQVMKPILLGSIMDHFNSNDQTLDKNKDVTVNTSNSENENDSDIVKQIKELLDTRVRPAVAMDGGDIVYQNFEDGVVYLHMQGACSGCPSSTATLKMGIENMLKHYVPEVKEVRPVDA
ncbi:NifU family protein [Alphaproteobacteria bacterium]|nr:NifU family protein [Alphaproteobacteria bacterium]